MTLSWTPLNSQPTAVYVSTPNPSLYAGGPAQEMISSATDAANQMIPGLPITWSSSNKLDLHGEYQRASSRRFGAGTGTLTATVSGVSGSMTIVVYAVQPLLNDIVGPLYGGPGLGSHLELECAWWNTALHVCVADRRHGHAARSGN